MTTQKDFDLLKGKSFVLKGRLTAPDHFSEGYTQLNFGYPLVKVLLHTVIDPKAEEVDSDLELRKASQYLTMPTVKAIELAHMILVAAKNSEERLMRDLSDRAQEKVRKILQNVKVSPSTQDLKTKSLPTPPKAGISAKGVPKVRVRAALKKSK